MLLLQRIASTVNILAIISAVLHAWIYGTIKWPVTFLVIAWLAFRVQQGAESDMVRQAFQNRDQRYTGQIIVPPRRVREGTTRAR